MPCNCPPPPVWTGWTTSGASLVYHFYSRCAGNAQPMVSYCARWQKGTPFYPLEPPLDQLCVNCLKRVQKYIELGYLPSDTYTG